MYLRTVWCDSPSHGATVDARARTNRPEICREFISSLTPATKALRERIEINPEKPVIQLLIKLDCRPSKTSSLALQLIVTGVIVLGSIEWKPGFKKSTVNT